MEKIKVLFISDSNIICEFIQLSLKNESENNIRIKTSSYDNYGNNIIIKDELPDLVLITLHSDTYDCFKTIKMLRGIFPKIKILVLYDNVTRPIIIKFMRNGVDGFISLDLSIKELIIQINKASEGELDSCSIGMIKTIEYSNSSKTDNDKKLTECEIKVLKLISQGFSNKEIANRLISSIHTIRTHRKNIMRKLNLHSSVVLANYAISEGLVDL